MDYLQDIAVQKISNRAHEQIRKISRRMRYPSMKQRMTFAFMHKMCLIRRHIGLRYTKDENTIEWQKRKVEYTPATLLQTNFQDLLKSECENNCSFLFALQPENINNEVLSGIGCAHIFVNLKQDFEQKNG